MDEKARIGKIQSITMDQPGIYRIKIQGRLSRRLQDRFDEMAVSVDGPITTFTGKIADQSALYGLVARVRDLGLPLILVELVRPVDQGG